MKSERYRRDARFMSHRDCLRWSRPIDGNGWARIITRLIAIENATRPEGCQNGVIGRCGIAVARALRKCMSRGTGLCCPVIKRRKAAGDSDGAKALPEIMKEMGNAFSPSTIFAWMENLKKAGALEVQHRLVRRPGTVDGVPCVVVEQTSSLYRFKDPHPNAELIVPLRRALAGAKKLVASVVAAVSVSKDGGESRYRDESIPSSFSNPRYGPATSSKGYGEAFLKTRLVQPSRQNRFGLQRRAENLVAVSGLIGGF
jgi:hypothetical protein